LNFIKKISIWSWLFLFLNVYDMVATFLAIHWHVTLETNIVVITLGWLPALIVKLALLVFIFIRFSNPKTDVLLKVALTVPYVNLMLINTPPALVALKIIFGY
jgi:hypothetical protein